MSIYSIPQLGGCFAAAILGLFVLSRNPSRPVNRTFATFGFLTAIWLATVSIAYSLKPDQKQLAFFLMRISYSAVIFMVVPYLRLSTLILGSSRIELWVRLSVGLAAFFVGTVWLTNWFIEDLHHFHFGFYPNVGWIHPFFLLWLGISMTLIHVVLRLGSRQKDIDLRVRNQAKYIWFAFIALTPVVIDFVPNYGVDVYPSGFLFVLAFAVVTAYAILRHQLLDIEVVIKRTLRFAGLVGSVVAVVSLVAFVSQDVLVRFVTIPKWLSNVFAAAIIAVLYEPLRNWLTNATEKYLFQKKYDYKELLKKFTDEVMLKVDLKPLIQTTVNTLSETVKLESCGLLLFNKDTRKYELAASKGTNGHQLVLDEQEPFITFLREAHEPIGHDGQLGKVRFPEAVTDRLKQLNARLCLPLEVHEDLIGVLCLGKKKSDEEFSKDDLDILLPLAKTLAIAVSNAQLFDELAKTQAEAAQKEKLAVIGTLSAGINHEICNPLGIVKAQCEAFLLDLEDGILIGKSSQEVLDRTSTIMRGALKQIDRATAITQKLSNFAKPIKEPTAQPVSVAQEIDEVLLLVGHDLKLEKIDVMKELQLDLPAIVVDRRQFQEVLFNLIRNAGQAIKPPGTIWVRIHEREGQVRIEIEDTGSGIPPDKLGKIYDPFFTTKEPGKGTGLGLFIVRQIIERNKGRISVESTVGKGTTFFLDFPAAKQIAVAV